MSARTGLTVAECTRLLARADLESLPSLLLGFAGDARCGVRRACEIAERRLVRHDDEEARLLSLTRAQAAAHDAGYAVVAGLDEVGRGAIAGPVTAGAVVLPLGARIHGLDDSKRLTPARRRELASRIHDLAGAYAHAHVWPDRIDAAGIETAVREAMNAALQALVVPVDHALVDGRVNRLCIGSTSIVKGDATVACIAAASIVAKVARDDLMTALDSEHPGYDLAVNKGYYTVEHMASVRRLGPCRLHRLTWAPFAEDAQTQLF